jgi:hypothetical protein
MSEITRILQDIEQGESKAAAELLPLVYAELRHLAAHKMAQEAPGQTLQPTPKAFEAQRHGKCKMDCGDWTECRLVKGVLPV